MRRSLRRSCTACAKSKHSCDLGTPRCSRCVKRKVDCVYVNEPLTTPNDGAPGRSGTLTRLGVSSIDPFNSYPPTRLPPAHVQRLIYSFLNKIAFEYYPLDLSAESNPFLVSWWPLALADPALFHVSLQTASLDEERAAQKGFHTSEMLMADCVALLRRKVGDVSLAVQDETMNSVITLATIEFGKGNTKVAEMHVNGVKQMVALRGGIHAVRQTSPLTARMVSWVSMLIMGRPQFDTQDDLGRGLGLPPVPQWQLHPAAVSDDLPELRALDVGGEVWNVFIRLRSVFRQTRRKLLPSAQLHDLTCFVIHRLLLSAADSGCRSQTTPLTESVRYATILYMFLIQGPTYFSHEVIFHQMLNLFVVHTKELEVLPRMVDSLDVWLVTVGLVAATGTPQHDWLRGRAIAVATALHLHTWDDVFGRIKDVLWSETSGAEVVFRAHWSAIIDFGHRSSPDAGVCMPT